MAKLWVDDMRDAPDDSWTEVRKVEPAINALSKFWPEITEISLDHDIENRPDDETFKPVAHYIGMCYAKDFQRGYLMAKQTGHAKIHSPKIRIHSDNPVGAKELVSILGDYGMQATWEPFTSDKEFKTKYGL